MPWIGPNKKFKVCVFGFEFQVKASVEPVSQGPVDGSRAFPLGGKRIVVPDKHSVPESSLATILRDIPLDLSLKTTVRIVSSDSLHWLVAAPALILILKFM